MGKTITHVILDQKLMSYFETANNECSSVCSVGVVIIKMENFPEKPHENGKFSNKTPLKMERFPKFGRKMA